MAIKREGDGGGGYSHNKHSVLTSPRLSMLQINQESKGLFFSF